MDQSGNTEGNSGLVTLLLRVIGVVFLYLEEHHLYTAALLTIYANSDQQQGLQKMKI